MSLESFCNTVEKYADNCEKKRAEQSEKLGKAFQGNRFNEGVGPRHIPAINEGMVDQSVNGVMFKRKVFTVNGEKVEGVFPNFDSKYTVKLPSHLYCASDDTQMEFCTKRLADRIRREPEFAENFTSRQLEQIRNGEARISGLTWHHNERPGVMQLVDAGAHSAARHTGGRSIWGGGSGNR